MTGTVYRVNVNLPSDSGLPEDTIVNTWHFLGDAGQSTAQDGADIVAALQAGYSLIDEHLAGALVNGPFTVVGYNLLEDEPRVPSFEGSLTVTLSASTSPLPAENAICLSYRAAIGSGDVAARRRGRIFLGPFTAGAVQVTSGRVLVDGAVIASMRAMGEAVLDAADATNTPWVVFSPTEAAALPSTSWPAAASFDVVGGWVDNAWDTQRRRGQDALNRYLWPV